MKRYSLPLRILATLLLLTLLMPGWGLLSSPSNFEKLPLVNVETIGSISPADH